MQMRASLVMDADPVGPRLGEGRNKLVRILDHEMAIERKLCHLAEGLYYWRPQGDIGNEVAIHHVDMDDGAAALLRRSHGVGQVRKIRRENGRSKLRLIEPDHG